MALKVRTGGSESPGIIKQILIKSYSNVGNFGTCLRVTIGARQYMERFLDALFELDNIN